VRRACALLSVARSTVGYQPRLAVRDAPAVAVMHELAAQYPRYGYRRIQVIMARRGPGLGLRFCIRCLCQRTAVEVPDSCR